MKTIVFFLLCLFSIQLQAQSDEEMKAWMEYMTPSDVHKQMAESDGHWTAQITMWYEPGAEPIKSEGSCENKMILEGRYQESNFHGDFQGMPMEGKSLLSYDNATKEYKSIWIDNFGTGMMVLVGQSKDGQTLELKGEMIDPMTGNPLLVREVYTYIDKNTEKMEMYYVMDGEEFQSMEIIFKRKNH